MVSATRILRPTAVICVALALGCTSDRATAPSLYTLSGPVVVTGFLVSPTSEFRGTRVLSDTDGIVVNLSLGAGKSLQTTTVDGKYRFSGLPPGGYAVSARVSRSVRDSSRILTIIRSDVVSGDTLRLRSRGDLYIVPNPAFPTMRLYFQLYDEAHVYAEVLDVAGRRVRVLLDEVMPAGLNDVGWLGDDSLGVTVPGGLYWVNLEALGEVRTHAMFR